MMKRLSILSQRIRAEPRPKLVAEIALRQARPIELAAGEVGHILSGSNFQERDAGAFYSVLESLENIKSIRFSRGTVASRDLRGPDCLSGLRFDFYGRSPVILGQWIEECDSLDLELGEEIGEFQTYFNAESRLELHRYLGFSITTTFGQTKTVFAAEPNPPGATILPAWSSPQHKFVSV